MKLLSLLALSTLAVTPAVAEETRHMESHEHGVSKLDVAFDGSQVAMELHAPGADVVGFEYAATSAEDLAKVEAALLVLAKPLELFGLPDGAQCNVVQANAELESDAAHEGHEDHDHEKHDAHDDKDHNDHADHDDHDAHDEHDGHDKHDAHDAHAEAKGHTEFHAEYLLECATPSALTEISFTYFDAFPNAREVEVQVISDSGARAFEVERDAPKLDLRDLN